MERSVLCGHQSKEGLLRGFLTAIGGLRGCISDTASLGGVLTVPTSCECEGEDREYWETENQAGGLTAYISKEVSNG